MLLHDIPLNLRDEGPPEPAAYFIEKAEFKKLNELIDEFAMGSIQTDLIFCYLNMIFAGCLAEWEDDFRKDLGRKKEDMVGLIDFLKEFSDKKLSLLKVDFIAKRSHKQQGVAPVERTFTGHIAMQFLEELFAAYESIPSYKTAKMMYDGHVKYGSVNMTRGYKNMRKQKQSYYANVLYRHINKTIFLPPEEMQEWSDIVRHRYTLLKKHPQKQRYLFVGKLMLMSGLLVYEEDPDENTIIDLIKKKIKVPKKTKAAPMQRREK
jgi:hypothetical protein